MLAITKMAGERQQMFLVVGRFRSLRCIQTLAQSQSVMSGRLQCVDSCFQVTRQSCSNLRARSQVDAQKSTGTSGLATQGCDLQGSKAGTTSARPPLNGCLVGRTHVCWDSQGLGASLCRQTLYP